ncbi:hypothetical protein IFM89_026817 [Coptis chinensis]|uniref:Uncharacterized protein n=1 Tax=Coptis chinensis TaxID=261450 RepID=A0A835IE21_9MAGN|nr:hypothetical protein IFM89_026817 [Coptis chinensis]
MLFYILCNFCCLFMNLVQKVEKQGANFEDLRELASAQSLDTFTLIYTNILEHQPDCPHEVVEKLVGLLRAYQERMPRSKELLTLCPATMLGVVQECKEIYENSLVDGNPPKAGFVFPKVKCLSHSKGSLWRKLT